MKRKKLTLENLLETLKTDQTDSSILNQIGLLYLYNKEHYDPIIAEGYLLDSIKYSNKLTAETYKDLAYCQQSLVKITEAINTAKIGFSLDNSMLDIKIIELECEFLLLNKDYLYETITNLCNQNTDYINLINDSLILSQDLNIINILNIKETNLSDDIIILVNKILKYKPYFDVYFEKEYQPYFFDSDKITLFGIIGVDKKQLISNTNKLFSYINTLKENKDFNTLKQLVDFVEEQLSNYDNDFDIAIKYYYEELSIKNEYNPELDNKVGKYNKICLILIILAMSITISSIINVPLIYIILPILLTILIYKKQ